MTSRESSTTGLIKWRHVTELIASISSTTTMANVVDWRFYYPHPDFSRDILVTTPHSGYIGPLWNLAKQEVPSLSDLRADSMFYIVRSSFLYTTGGFSHIYSSRPTCLLNHAPHCSLAAEIGFGSTVMMMTGGRGTPKWSPQSSLMCRLLGLCMSLSSPKNVRPSL
jgi:hypothetical protein